MIKSLLVYTVSFGILFLIVQFSQEAILNNSEILLRYKTWDTNLFFAVASLIICVHFKLFSQIKNLQPQLGFIYLPTLFIKGALFYFAFKDSVFNLGDLNMAERLNLLIPLLSFLGLEVFFVVKIINKKVT